MIDVILLEPEHEGNVGAVCRAMANFGFYRLIVVNAQCDLTRDAFFQHAKHAQGKVSVIHRKRIPSYDLLIGTTAKVSDDYNVERTPVASRDLAGYIEKYVRSSKNTKKRIGLLFGREGNGLSNEELARCDIVSVIDADAIYPTLNLSHAAAIYLYDLHSVLHPKTVLKSIEYVTQDEQKRLIRMMSKIVALHFPAGSKRDVQRTIWRNVLRRAVLSKREAFGMMGLLRRVLAKKK
ncbi:MAG: RNA methyltransferase [Candidatus Woesearchaeota archaeon]